MNKIIKIAVTTPDVGGFLAWQFTKFSLFLSGAKAIRTSPSHPIDLKKVDGIVFGGGSDINPYLYKQKKHPKTNNIDKKRDEFELKLLKQSIKLKLPILGICRGMQLINIYFRGSLIQDIFDLNLKNKEIYKITPFAYKKVFILPNTKLYSILKQKVIFTNSIHHQSIKTLGKDLKMSAYDENKLIYAIEKINYPFLIGVQWHPEYMINDLKQRKIFKNLVYFAKKQKKYF